jgi:hypothetical protein
MIHCRLWWKTKIQFPAVSRERGGEHEHLSAFHYVRLLYIEESSLEAKMRGSGFNYGVHSYMHIFFTEENIEKQARKCAVKICELVERCWVLEFVFSFDLFSEFRGKSCRGIFYNIVS